MVLLLDGEKIEDILFVFDSRTWRTDKHTDTAWQHRPRLCRASCIKKTSLKVLYYWLLKLITDRHEVSRDLFATAELRHLGWMHSLNVLCHLFEHCRRIRPTGDLRDGDSDFPEDKNPNNRPFSIPKPAFLDSKTWLSGFQTWLCMTDFTVYSGSLHLTAHFCIVLIVGLLSLHASWFIGYNNWAVLLLTVECFNRGKCKG